MVVNKCVSDIVNTMHVYLWKNMFITFWRRKQPIFPTKILGMFHLKLHLLSYSFSSAKELFWHFTDQLFWFFMES